MGLLEVRRIREAKVLPNGERSRIAVSRPLSRPIAERPDKGGPPLKSEEEPGSVVRLFASDLAKLKGVAYHLDIFEVNSVNYGAPQIRERVLFIGNVFGVTVDFPSLLTGKGLKMATRTSELS